MDPSSAPDERTADAVLSARAPDAHPDRLPHDLAEVAAFADTLRSAASVSARPNAELARVLAEGLPSDRPAAVPGRPSGSRHGLANVRSKLTAAGLAAKAGLATAAVLGATAGVGAAGVLSDSFPTPPDELRGEERVEVVVEESVREDRDLRTESSDRVDTVTVGEVPEGIEAHDRRLGRAFGEGTARDAGDGPGVDGEGIAREASDGRRDAGRDRAAEASEGRSQRGDEAATRRSAPEGVPGERPSTPASDGTSDRADRPERAPAPGSRPEQAEERGGTAETAPADGAPEEARGGPRRTPDR